MAFSKKNQLENKVEDVKSSVFNKHNLKLIFFHDSDLSMKNHSFGGRLQYLTILKELALFKKKDFEKFSESDVKSFFWSEPLFLSL
ncbi:MAG: hypothetical protein ABH850_02035 [Candidatus Micrarchaeota archaeon]